MSHQAVVDESDPQALLGSDVSEIRAIKAGRDGNRIVLRGVVGSFYYKQLAQELVKASMKDAEIDNQVSVVYAQVQPTAD